MDRWEKREFEYFCKFPIWVRLIWFPFYYTTYLCIPLAILWFVFTAPDRSEKKVEAQIMQLAARNVRFAGDVDFLTNSVGKYWKAIFRPQHSSPAVAVSQVTLTAAVPDGHIIFTLSESDLNSALRLCFPPSWVHGELASVRQIGERLPMNEQLGPCVGNEADAILRDGREMLLSISTRRASCTRVLEILAHELGHANDWESDAEMTLPQRVNLLRSVIDRVRSPNRFESEYVAAIFEPSDAHSELYDKAKEYWAVIVAAYLLDHPYLPYSDAELVRQQLRLADPSRNPQEWRVITQAVLSDWQLRAEREAEQNNTLAQHVGFH